MDFEGVKWVIGVVTGAVVLVIGGFRHLGNKMSKQHADLHGRIDDVKEKYVRRDDFESHMERQEKTAEKIEQNVEKINEKLDRLIGRS